MKQNWRCIALTLAFISGLAMLVSGCVVRASGSVRARPVYVVDAPPPKPRYVVVKPRSGYVWVRGHYQYVNTRWAWKRGHWEPARSGYQWEPGHWERRGSRWHWVEGRWVRGTVVRDHRRPAPPPPRQAPPPRRPPVATPPPSRYPTSAPPPPRSERPGQRAGYVWVTGRWEWRNGRWKWRPGTWQRARTGHQWVPGHWEQRGDRYVWVQGHWEQAVRVRDHRKQNNNRRNETVPIRRKRQY